MDKLKNKVAVITGGSSGIGLATAKEMVANVVNVVIFARGRQALNNGVKELGDNSYAVQGDVSKLSDLDQLFAETKWWQPLEPALDGVAIKIIDHFYNDS